MECHRSSGQNVSDFYQEAATCSEVSTYHRIQKRIGEAIISKFVSVVNYYRISAVELLTYLL